MALWKGEWDATSKIFISSISYELLLLRFEKNIAVIIYAITYELKNKFSNSLSRVETLCNENLTLNIKSAQLV